MRTMTVDVIHNSSQHRFETTVDGHVAYVQYRMKDGVIEFIHTEVPRELEGRGIASRIVQTALGYAREQKLPVIPRCPFVAAWIHRHPTYEDLVREWV